MKIAPYPKRAKKNDTNSLLIYLLVSVSILGVSLNFYSISLLKDSIKQSEEINELMVASINDFVAFKKKAILPNTATQLDRKQKELTTTDNSVKPSVKEQKEKSETKQQRHDQSTAQTDTQENKLAETIPTQPQKTYTVNDGDTLFSIYLKTGISVDYLKEVNNLSSSIIQPGQQLVIE